MDINEGDIVRVKWTDAWEYSGWTLIETLEAILDEHRRENETVGFVLRKTPDYLALLGSVGWDVENKLLYNGSGCMVIPASIIREYEVLKKVEIDE